MTVHFLREDGPLHEIPGRTLSEAGARVEESCPKVLASLPDFWTLPYFADGGEWIRRLLKQSGTQRWDPHIDWHWQLGALSGEKIGELVRTWQQFRVEMLSWLEDYDVLICPVNAKASWISGFGDDDKPMLAFTYTAAFNMTGWPAAVVRGGTSSDGMPIGVQVVSHPWREDICLAVAKHLEIELGGWHRPNI